MTTLTEKVVQARARTQSRLGKDDILACCLYLTSSSKLNGDNCTSSSSIYYYPSTLRESPRKSLRVLKVRYTFYDK